MNRYTLLYYSVFALLLLTTSCKDGNAFGDGFLPSLTLEESNVSPETPTQYVTPETTTVSFSSEAASQTISVSANIRYYFECKSDWLTVSPTNNELIYQALTITVDENTTSEARTAEITLFIMNGSLTHTTMATITVTQNGNLAKGSGTIDDPYNVIAALSIANSLASGAKTDQAYYIKGKVVSVRDQFSALYGNASFYISDDGTTAGQFYVFRALYLGNQKWTDSDKQLNPGDEVIVYAKLTNYMGNTPETVQGDCYLYSLNGMTEDNGDADPLGLCPDSNHPHMIDMGLSVKWACCNVGASSPIDYGDYFAWGETTGYNSGKTTFDWSTYKWCNGPDDTMTKYCNSSSYGTVDNKTQLELSDDAARANWGSPYRMPTIDEVSALDNTSNCTWTWTTLGGVNGYKVTSKFTGNSIFLPAAGSRSEASLYGAGSYGGCWSSSLGTYNDIDARVLHFGSNGHSTNFYYRCYGQSVRPVTE